MTQKRGDAATSGAQDKYNLLYDPTFLAAAIPADAGIYRGVRICTGVVARITVVSIQMGSGKSQSRGLAANVSGGWFKDSLLVERKRGPVKEARAHLWIRELWHLWWCFFIAGLEGSGECRDRISQGGKLHFLGRNLRDVIPHVRREERIFVFRATSLVH